MKYTKRMSMYESFVRKQRAVLFATDIVARGLGTYASEAVVDKLFFGLDSSFETVVHQR